jgi:hypothetical protein
MDGRRGRVENQEMTTRGDSRYLELYEKLIMLQLIAILLQVFSW